MPNVFEVELPAVDPARFADVLAAGQMKDLQGSIEAARGLFDGRTIWNVNSTAKGGGVAEMLNSLLAYVRGAGVDTRWLVIGGDPEFFAITKRIHNRLHGAEGDAGELGDAERRHYEEVLAGQAEQIRARVRPGDVIILHDPQTAGLSQAMVDAGLGVIWRCHVGLDTPNQRSRATWEFLLPFVRAAHRQVFSRQAFAWEGLDADRIRVVAPSIDPFSPKNHQLDDSSVRAILHGAGVIADGRGHAATYRRVDGSPGRIEHRATVVEVTSVDDSVPLVVQVSRWDRLKDPIGVLTGFAEGVVGESEAHLMLAGPSVAEVADDPEGKETFEEVRRCWEQLDESTRARIHLVCLPMDDDEENAVMVNALQRHATVVVQKSLAEGFGLTVAEAMWKSRPVVASRIGGIQDQVEDGVSGILLDDPADLDAFAAAVSGLLRDADHARAVGEAAHDRVQQDFLGSRHLAQYVEICGEVLQRATE